MQCQTLQCLPIVVKLSIIKTAITGKRPVVLRLDLKTNAILAEAAMLLFLCYNSMNRMCRGLISRVPGRDRKRKVNWFSE